MLDVAEPGAVRSTECPSSVESDRRGGSSTLVPSSVSKVEYGDDALSTAVIDADDIDTRGDEVRCEPSVLTLKRDWDGVLNEMMLSRRPGTPLWRSMLCRRVRSSTFFSVFGKYAARCVVMSSLGGRCPKKLRSFDGAFLEPFVGLAEFCVSISAAGPCATLSGSGTPSPLRMLTELARFIALV